jgi:hypothetical protein
MQDAKTHVRKIHKKNIADLSQTLRNMCVTNVHGEKNRVCVNEHI